MSPSGDQLVARISGGAPPHSAPGTLGALPGVQSPFGPGSALRGGADLGGQPARPEDPYQAGYAAGQKAYEDLNMWLMTGGPAFINRIMGARPARNSLQDVKRQVATCLKFINNYMTSKRAQDKAV